MSSLACLDGLFLPLEEARASVNDRAYVFGDAVYEVYRLYQGRCWLEEEHGARLRRSLRELRIEPVDFDRLNQRMHEAISRSGIQEGTVYLQISRGNAPRKHPFPKPAVKPVELIVVKPFDSTEADRLRDSGVSTFSHPDWRWRRSDIKSTNLLGNILALQSAQDRGGFEAVLHEPDGQITEATHSSLLWVRDGRLEGTPESANILPGTTRHAVIRLAKEAGIPFAETTITLDDLKSVDEVLLTGTTVEVMPVNSIDDQRIGEGRPGPITRRLQQAFQGALERWLAPLPA